MTERARAQARRLRTALDAHHPAWQTGELELVGSGLDAAVFRAGSRAFGPVAIRVPWTRWISNANDPSLDARELLVKEQLLANHMNRHGVPTPRAFALHTGADDFDFLVSAYVLDDGSDPDPVALGAMLRRIHGAPIPAEIARALDTGDLARTLANRIADRLGVVRRLSGAPLPIVPADALRAIAAGAHYRPAVLHMDFRRVNLRIVAGEIRGVLDWSNALVGDPALELARVAEAGERDRRFDTGYQLDGAPPAALDALYRLDTAVMLAVVFLSESPDPVPAKRQIERVAALLAALGWR
jgi:aminoglycoside phosphotransferase (APT) family kinase protein